MYKIFRIKQYGRTWFELRESGTFGNKVITQREDIAELRKIRDILTENIRSEEEEVE